MPTDTITATDWISAIAAALACLAAFILALIAWKQSSILGQQTKLLKDQADIFRRQAGYQGQQTTISKQQAGIMDRQTDISNQQLTIIKEQEADRKNANRIDLDVSINEYGEEDTFGETYAYLDISVRNKSRKRTVVIDSFWLALQYDGREHRLRLNYIKGKNTLKHDRGKIDFPYGLMPETKLSIILGNSNEYLDYFLNPETGYYNFPDTECNLIAHFEDQLGNLYESTPFKIL